MIWLPPSIRAKGPAERGEASPSYIWVQEEGVREAVARKKLFSFRKCKQGGSVVCGVQCSLQCEVCSVKCAVCCAKSAV